MKIGRIKLRWTLGGLMLQIAVMAVLLALYHHLQKWQREHELDIVLMSIERMLNDRQIREHPECYADTRILTPDAQKQGYFEYGSETEEPPK